MSHEAAKLAPAATVAGLDFAGIGLQEWVYILTIIYLLLQIAHLAWKTWRNKDGSD